MEKNFKCVILCGGRGTRIIPYSEYVPKVMIEIKGKPALGYVIDYWKKYTQDFIFVVGYKKELVIEYISKLITNPQFIDQKDLKGIAHAISCTKDYVSDNFFVILGDCICDGEFHFPEDFEQGIGIWRTNDDYFIKQNYSVEIQNNFISNVIEKPKKITNDLCGMGVYFFNKRVFTYIEKTKPSKVRNEVEITDTIQNMIDSGEKITPIFFTGNYLNVTFPYDVKEAESIIFRKKKQIDQYMIFWRKFFLPFLKRFYIIRSWIVGDKLLPYINDGDLVLNFGFGNARHQEMISKYIVTNKNINITCINVVKHKSKVTEFICYKGGKLPFNDNQFDVVLAPFVLHHTENPDFYLKELIRVSKNKILICEDRYINKMEAALARFICISSNLILGNTEIERHFKRIEDLVDPFLKNGVKLVTFKKIRPHPIPFIPTRDALILLQK